MLDGVEIRASRCLNTTRGVQVQNCSKTCCYVSECDVEMFVHHAEKVGFTRDPKFYLHVEK